MQRHQYFLKISFKSDNEGRNSITRFAQSKMASCPKNTNSVIMLKSKLICRFKCHICWQLCFFKQKSVFKIRRDKLLDDAKNISLRHTHTLYYTYVMGEFRYYILALHYRVSLCYFFFNFQVGMECTFTMCDYQSFQQVNDVMMTSKWRHFCVKYS